MARVTLELEEQPSETQLGFLYGRVRQFNRTVGGHEPPQLLACFLRDGEGTVVGGVSGELWGHSLHVSALWVADHLRGQGHGASLLHELERCAAGRGHRLAYVETLSYQARPFYEKHGYRVFGELNGIADGCILYFLQKEIA